MMRCEELFLGILGCGIAVFILAVCLIGGDTEAKPEVEVKPELEIPRLTFENESGDSFTPRFMTMVQKDSDVVTLFIDEQKFEMSKDEAETLMSSLDSALHTEFPLFEEAEDGETKPEVQEEAEVPAI